MFKKVLPCSPERQVESTELQAVTPEIRTFGKQKVQVGREGQKHSSEWCRCGTMWHRGEANGVFLPHPGVKNKGLDGSR